MNRPGLTSTTERGWANWRRPYPGRRGGYPASGAASAFTLIELVISASLMSIILSATYLCFTAGTASQKLVESRADVIQSARVALALISADLRCACPLPNDYQFLGMHRMLGDIEADNLDFATHHYEPRRPREADFCEVSYFLDKDRQTGKCSLWRRRNPTLAPDALTGGQREEIVRDVAGLRFEYYDGFDWFNEWGEVNGQKKVGSSLRESGNLYGMPEAVRVTLWLGNGSPAKSESASATEIAEPPFVVQTVARLNLAATAQSIQPSGVSTNSASREPPTPPR